MPELIEAAGGLAGVRQDKRPAKAEDMALFMRGAACATTTLTSRSIVCLRRLYARLYILVPIIGRYYSSLMNSSVIQMFDGSSCLREVV